MDEQNKSESNDEVVEIKNSISEREILVKEKQLDLNRIEIENNISSQKSATLSPVTATIIVALIGFLGTSIATIIQNANTSKLENEKFQSTLILKALESPNQDERIKFLRFLTTLQLISNDSLAKRLDKFIDNQPENIPLIVSSTTNSNANDELGLSRSGKQSFLLDSLERAVQLIEDARKVQSSKVWESSLPYLIVAYWRLGNDQEAAKNIDFMFEEIQKPLGYLTHATTVGFLINEFSDIRSTAPLAYQNRVDEIIDKLIKIKEHLN